MQTRTPVSVIFAFHHSIPECFPRKITILFRRRFAGKKTIQVRFMRVSCDPEAVAQETRENARTPVEEE